MRLLRTLLVLAVAAVLCFSQTQTPVDNETPHGLIDGTNTLFILLFTPNPISSLHLYRNGLHLAPKTDYLVGENRIHFTTPPQPSDVLLATYRH